MLKRFLIFSFVSIILLSFSSCIKEKDFCSYDGCAYKAPQAERQALQDYITAENIVATEHCSGMYYRIDIPGTGTAPRVCDYITFKYKGMLTNGNVFENPANAITYQLSGLITGFQNALPLLKEGGKITLYIPPSLAYGSQARTDQNGNVIIPANSILIFEVELVDVM